MCHVKRDSSCFFRFSYATIVFINFLQTIVQSIDGNNNSWYGYYQTYPYLQLPINY